MPEVDRKQNVIFSLILHLFRTDDLKRVLLLLNLIFKLTGLFPVRVYEYRCSDTQRMTFLGPKISYWMIKLNKWLLRPIYI